MNELKTVLRPALIAFALLMFITGIVYPLATTGIAQLVLPRQANGSLIERDGKVIGSALIGQSWSDPKYFWGRPSATSPMPNNANASSGSNLGPSNPALMDVVKARIASLQAANPDASAPVPMDLVTASASGLDPEISPEAAMWQAPRVAKARGLRPQDVIALIQKYIEPPTFGLLGMPRVNVLELNLALDQLASIQRGKLQ